MVDLSKDILFIDHGAILLLNESTKTYEKRYGDSGTPTCLKSDEPILGITARRAREVSIYDIEEDPIFSIEKDSCRRVMEQFKASLIIPLLYEERMIGLMILGEKKSGKFYRRQDILLLTTLANQGAVAIENARLQDSFINALEISKRELQLLNKAKSKALDLLSHELKTPLSVISMNLELLKRDGEKEPDTQKRGRVFERLETHLKRLLAVQGATEKIIQSYDKVEKTLGEEEIDTSLEDDLKRFDLFLTIQKILESVKHRTSHRDLIYDFFGTLGSYIRMNPRIVEDVIESLLRNAIENTPDEGLIRVIIESTRKTCTLKVCDFGTGITEDNQKYLFEGLFYTQESELYSSKQPYDFNAGGKGLDLFRIKVYSRRFGFEVSMESKRCVHIPGAFDNCPGKISECVHCKTREDCLASGGSVFTVTFKSE
jgi:signal transduction histidine kinase